MGKVKNYSMKCLKLAVIILCILVCVSVIGILVNEEKIILYEGLLKTDKDVISNLCGRYPGDEFEVLGRNKIKVYTEDYDGRKIEKDGYSYDVKSKKTNVEFNVSDDLYFGCSGHVVDRAIFCIKDTYKESWYMQIAKNVGCDDKIIEINNNNDISLNLMKFSSFEEFTRQIYNYKCEILEGDLYRIIKTKNQYEDAHFIVHTGNGTTVDIPLYELTSIDDLKAYEYFEKYINN